jgi:hypothetical protein
LVLLGLTFQHGFASSPDGVDFARLPVLAEQVFADLGLQMERQIGEHDRVDLHFAPRLAAAPDSIGAVTIVTRIVFHPSNLAARSRRSPQSKKPWGVTTIG